ncbi:probable 6-phosphogluconolactonase 4, chloroplastic [Olea europaea subsp. europaea]|uniref:Probable 6-phosphogluconolactonase n=1 Tax=Olea europaea subsp. europaea TaxID=158383 RepID=A0A8S0U6I6_OLEEU|nr:probable 6-phosphogluconolactonase 4, chloroplastic [Olea europaea subsp. europaea]
MALANPVDNQSNNVLKCPSPASMDLTPRKCKTNVRKFQSEEDVAKALAKYVADLSEKYIREKGYFSVVLSGGTLIHTLRKLVECPYKGSVDWSKWLIFWVDERVVPLNSPDSNYKLAYDGFLSKVPISPCHIYAINDKLSPKAAADNYEARLKNLVNKETIPVSDASGFPKFDLMLLGIGPDGHVASLFPTRLQRFEKKRWVSFITDSPKPPPERITFTFPVINSASEIAMVVTGAELADAVKITLGGVLPTGLTPLPCMEVSPEEELTWFLDKDAASKL